MFEGLGNLANLGSVMKQAQEMGSKMHAINEQLKHKRATGSAGGGLVEVDVNGMTEVLAVRIDPTLIEKQDREMLEDLLPAAFNSASQKAREFHAEAMGEITGGINLPPGLQDILGQFGDEGPASSGPS